MKEWQAIFRDFGQIKNGTYLYFDQPEGLIRLSEKWGHKEALRWQRVKEDFKNRKIKVLNARSHVRLINVSQTEDGFKFTYALQATWDLEQKGKRFQQAWQEERMSHIRRADGWIVEEDRPLVEEGCANGLVKQGAKPILSPILSSSGEGATPEGGGKIIPTKAELAGLYLRLPKTFRGYERHKAVEYAHRYWNSHNPQFKHFDVDCTNYVSQCLWAGGAPMTYRQSKSEGWWYRFSASPQWSYSWSVAHAMRWYLGTSKAGLRAEEVSAANQLMPGDVICYDFEGDGRFNHTTFVVSKDGNNEPLVNAHTSNSQNRYWAYRDSTAWTPKIRYKFFRILV